MNLKKSLDVCLYKFIYNIFLFYTVNAAKILIESGYQIIGLTGSWV